MESLLMKKFLRFTGLLFFLALPSVAFANDISGTGWVTSESDGDKFIILFEKRSKTSIFKKAAVKAMYEYNLFSFTC